MSTATREPVTTGPSTHDAQQVIVAGDSRRSNLPGLIALGLAIVGFIFAALLITAGIAWMLLLPAIILGIVGLTLRDRRKGTALAAVIIAVVALLLSFIGFRLPLGATGEPVGAGVVNNAGVNPLSGVIAGLGGNGQLAETGGQPGAGGGSTGTSPDGGLAVGVTAVDCHTPLATVTGLNLTGEICAVSVAVTNNGTAPINVNSANVTANADGSSITADATLVEDGGQLLDAQVAVGETTTGTVYVNLPTGSADIDSLTISGDGLADVTVQLGN